MADFVAEIRPRSFRREGFNSTHLEKDLLVGKGLQIGKGLQVGKDLQVDNDFVAEIRSTCYSQKELRFPEKGGLPQDLSNSYLENVLSARHFSKDTIVNLLRDSIVTLVEKLLMGQNISEIEGSVRISIYGDDSPVIVQLCRRFPVVTKANSLKDQMIDGCLNVKLKENEFLSLSTPYQTEVTPLASPVECELLLSSENSPHATSGYNTGKDSCSCSPAHDDSPLDPKLQSSSSEGETQSENFVVKQSQSDGDSGYLSNEKEKTDSTSACDFTDAAGHNSPDAANGDDLQAVKSADAFNESCCSGIDDQCSFHILESDKFSLSRSDFESSTSSIDCSDEMDDSGDDDEDTDFEKRLVIDESQGKDLTTSKIIDLINEKKSDRTKEENGMSSENISSPKTEPALWSLRREGQKYLTTGSDVDCQSDSCINKEKALIDIPEDVQMKVDAEPVVLHPQSVVSKVSGGFSCKICSRVLADTVSVSRHLLTKHDLHSCTFCCRTFTVKNNLKRHLRLHTGSRPYTCPQCLQSFSRKDDLKGHILRHSYNKPFRCSRCQKGYTDRASVKNHMAKEHSSRLMHVCPLCGEGFDCEEGYSSHKLSHPELVQFSCDLCSFVGTSALMTLKHGLVHKHKLFSCRTCNAFFADPFDYTSHLKKHKNSSISRFICCFCDVALGTYDQFIKHEYSHAPSNVHTCRTCRKQFRSKSHLEEHLLSHEKPTLDNHHIVRNIPENYGNDWLHQARAETKIFNYTEEMSSNEEFLAGPPVVFDVEEHVPLVSQEDTADDFQGQLLDLSMKKPSSPAFIKNDHNDSNSTTCAKVTGAASENVSRNGIVSAPLSLKPECEVSEEETKNLMEADNFWTKLYKRMSRCSDPELRSELNILLENESVREIAERSLEAVNRSTQPSYIKPRATFPIMSRVTEKAPSRVLDYSSKREPLQCNNRNISNCKPLRFNPTSRDKMADLAAKFMVARGSKLIGHRIPLKTVSPISGQVSDTEVMKQRYFRQQKHPSLANRSNWQLADAVNLQEISACNDEGRGPLSQQVFNDSMEMSCDSLDREATTASHIPTVVKSEALIDQTMYDAAPLDFRFQKKRDRNNNLGGVTRSSLNTHARNTCEICKEEFGSFMDLETHSVEIHRRYLCEFCGKSFTARPNRDRHVRYHTGERPYKCDLCDLAFFRGDDLKYHRTTRHPTAQPYVCTRCSASFTWGRDLDRHIKHSRCKL